MLRTLALVLGLGLVACGGGNKPAPQDPVEETSDDNLPDDSDMPVENEQCCCEYVDNPSEDPDDMTENHSLEYMSIGACDEAAGACIDDPAACSE